MRYFVRPDGDDRATGTSPETAWKTLTRAQEAPLRPGDRLLLQGGATFPGPLTLEARQAGTSKRLVTIGSYGEGRATIAAGTGPGIVVRNAAGIRLENLRVLGAGHSGGNQSDGILFLLDLPGATKLGPVRIERVEVAGFGLAGLSLSAQPSDGSRSGYRNVRFAHVASHDNGDAGINVFGAYSSTLPGYAHHTLIISHCRAWRNRGIADKGGHSGNGIVISQVAGARIERCIAFENGENSNYEGGGPVGIWAWDSDAVVIERCQSYDNRSRTLDGGGFDLDGGVTNSVMRFNKSRNNAGAGFMIYQYAGARPCFGNVVHHNISEDDGRTNLGGLFVGGGIAGALFHDNRVIVSARAGGPGEAFAAGADHHDNGEVLFRANRLMTRGGAPLVHAPVVQGDLRFVENILPDSGAILWDGVRYARADAWRAATGQG